jgi:hypothetical protein
MVILAPPQDSTLSSFDAALKDYYLNIVPENETYKKRPFFALVPKIVTFEGRQAPLPLMYSNPQGVSATFSSALGAQEPTQLAAFQLNRAAKYGFATLQGESYLAARSSVGSFVSSFATEIDNTFLEMTQDIHFDLYGDGSGIRSTVAVIAGLVITLANPSDVRKFSVGMSLEIAPAPTGAARVGPTYITAIERSTGLITLSALPAGTVVGDGIYRLGSRGPTTNLQGLAAWMPVGGPTSASFFGVDRTVDSGRLGSMWLDARGGSVYDALLTMCSIIDQNGGTPDYAFMHPLKVTELVKQLGNNVRYENMIMEDYANIGFKAVVVQTDFGEVRIIGDSMATPVSYNQWSAAGPTAYAGSFPIYVTQMNTWYLMSLDNAPHIIQDDGLFVVRSATADAIQVRLRFFGNLGNRAPGYSGVAVV